MKGVELPINTLVIVVLAVIVLLGILALYFGVWNSQQGGLTLEGAKNNACRVLLTMNCNQLLENITVNDFDADKDGRLNNPGPGTGACLTTQGDNLYMLCKCWYNVNETLCKTSICGC
jgi:hypothetical protein